MLGGSDEPIRAYASTGERQSAAERIADPEALQGMALFLASEAARYCTGYTYAGDGGWLAQ